MTFDEARRIIEGKLASYSVVVGHYPDIPVDSLYKRMQRTVDLGTSTQGGGSHASPQELWAIRHADEIADAARIERVMRRLPKEEKTLIFLRYIEHNNWHYIARTLHMSVTTAYRVRDRAIMVFAEEFRLLDPCHAEGTG